MQKSVILRPIFKKFVFKYKFSAVYILSTQCDITWWSTPVSFIGHILSLNRPRPVFLSY